MEIPDELCKDYMLRALDWRWRRAGLLVECDQLPRSDDNDKYVLDAIRHLRLAPSDRDRDLRCVEQLRQKEELTFIRSELEARLLADQSDEEIAKRLGCPVKVVKYYEAWFYNVRDRQQSPSYLWQKCVLPLWPAKAKRLSREGVWKLYAFLGGPAVIDEVIYDGVRSNSGDFWRTDATQTLIRRLNIWARTAPPEELAKYVSRVAALRRAVLTTEAEPDRTAKTTGEVLRSVQWDWSSGVYPLIRASFVHPHERTTVMQDDEFQRLVSSAGYE